MLTCLNCFAFVFTGHRGGAGAASCQEEGVKVCSALETLLTTFFTRDDWIDDYLSLPYTASKLSFSITTRFLLSQIHFHFYFIFTAFYLSRTPHPYITLFGSVSTPLFPPCVRCANCVGLMLMLMLAMGGVPCLCTSY